MENKKLYFDVEADQIDIKPILEKEFLELSMKPISTANPNRNNSWFTRDSLVASKDTFKNKPILGFFENGDFVSHNGEWKKDPETDMEYWDTLGKKGERPIGFIRESDEIEIVDDPVTGLSWIYLTCALWTQYNYKQVKRLLKDAKKAKENGKPVKNISVEVDITDYEVMSNGVMKINAFNLVGITILGSRNGVKVEPGIEGAELSVVDIMGTELFEKQMQGLRLAYEKLDGSEKNNKEDFSEMEKEQETTVSLNSEADENLTSPTDGITLEGQTSGTVDTGSQDAQFAAENKDPENSEPEVKTENEEQTKDETNKETNEVVHQNNEDHEEIQDINWLLDRLSGAASAIECVMHYYEINAEFIEGSDYIVPVLKKIYGQTVENEKELIGLLAKVAEGLTEEDKAEASYFAEHYDCKELYKTNQELGAKCAEFSNACETAKAECEALKAKNAELECKFEEIEKAEAHAKFMKEAKEVIISAKLPDEINVLFEKECEEGKYASIDELKTQIGLKLFEMKANEKSVAVETVPAKEAESFEASVDQPDTNAFVEDKGKTKKKDKWESIREYTGK